MRESRLYLNFFKNNWLLIFIPAIAGLLVGIVFYTSQWQYRATGTLKIINTNNLIDSSLISDQVVANIRANKVQLVVEGQLDSFKSGPDTVEVELWGRNSSTEKMEEVLDYVEQNFSVKRIGGVVSSRINQSLLYLITPLAVGLGLGILSALVRTYFKKF